MFDDLHDAKWLVSEPVMHKQPTQADFVSFAEGSWGCFANGMLLYKSCKLPWNQTQAQADVHGGQKQ